MKTLLSFLAISLPVFDLAGAVIDWNGAASSDYFSAANWVGGVAPTVNDTPRFPASATNKIVDLGGATASHTIFEISDGYTLQNGRLQVQGGGAGSEIRSSGTNTLNVGFGSYGDGNGVKFVQNAVGILTINGSRQSAIKPFQLSATDPQARIVFNGTVTGPSKRHAFTGSGFVEIAPAAILTGGTSTSTGMISGRTIFNGTDDTTHTGWTINETFGALYGTGTLKRPLLVGPDTPGRVSPGLPEQIGTLSAQGGASFGMRGHLEIEIGNAGESDVLVITGDLTIDADAVLTVRPLPGTTPSGNYLIATYSGTRTGAFIPLWLPAGYSVDYGTAGQVRLIAGTLPVAENIEYPADAGVLDVTQAPYNAIPNDGIDDTAAIQAALDAFPNGNRIIYLPNGVYDVSDTLNWPAGTPGATDYKRTILEGQTRDGAVLRLRDNLPAYAASQAKAVIFTGPAPAQRFRNAVRNLTLHTGSGNPGANGINFNASNQGTVRNVRIVSGDGQGLSGLNLAHTAEIGPLLIKDVEVIGFDYGIRTADAINGIVLENIRVEGQNQAGIRNTGQVFTLRKFTSINRVPAIINGTNPFGGLETGGCLTVTDATLIGVGEAIQRPAIEGTSFAFLRDVTSTGYLRVFQRQVPAGLQTVNDSRITEYVTAGVQTLFPSKEVSLRLPVQETPVVPRDPLVEWVSPFAFGATGDGSTDDTAAVQAAMDAGKKTVYFPAGSTFKIDGTVFIRGAVRRLIGTEGRMSGNGKFVLLDGLEPVVAFERMTTLPIEQNSARTLVMSHLLASKISGSGRGDIFIEDLVGGPLVLSNPRQRVWARQLNTEQGSETNVLNQGATLWVFGYKTERGNVKIDTLAGGFTELLGFHNYSTGDVKRENPADPTSPPFPALRIQEASASFAMMGESNFSSTNYIDHVQETRSGVANSLPRDSTPPRTAANGNVLTLFAGHTGAPKAPVELAAERASDTSATLAWADTAWNETGMVVERREAGGAFAPLTTLPAETVAFNDTGLIPSRSYEYRVRASNADGQSPPSNPAIAATLLTPKQSWKFDLLGDPNAPDDGDPDSDGLLNLAEYALVSSPVVFSGSPVPERRTYAEGERLALVFNRDPARTDITIEVEVSPDLNSWITIASSINGSVPTGAGFVAESDQGGGLMTVEVRDVVNIGSEARRFLRLRVR